MFFCEGYSATPHPLRAPLGEGLGVGGGSRSILKGKLTSFLESPPLKPLEMTYHMFIYGIGLSNPLPQRAPRGGGSGGTLKGKLM